MKLSLKRVPSAGHEVGQRQDRTLPVPLPPRSPPTLDSMPIFMMVPSTVSTSLMTSRMYQPLRNSMRSDRHTLWP